MQQLIVGGAVTVAVSSALYNGLKKDQVKMCDLCRGVGAIQALSFPPHGFKNQDDTLLQQSTGQGSWQMHAVCLHP
jgi:hypothetical protein